MRSRRTDTGTLDMYPRFPGVHVQSAGSLARPLLAEREKIKGVQRGEPGSEITAMCYGEYYPNPGPMAGGEAAYSPERHAVHNQRMSHWTAFLAEALGTAILALMVSAVTSAGNPLGPKNLAPA